jgi:hypothetical protein
MPKYRVRTPFSAFLARRESESTAVTLPLGAELSLLTRRREALLGMVDVAWNGREYAIFERDLQQKCEPLRRPVFTTR